MVIREKLESCEKSVLSPYAQLSSASAGRLRPEEPCELRTAFQVDRDRILQSKSFRRLKHKTQVFLAPTGDHYRTRLTHTLEVAQISRTVARALSLNEDLAEAIALGHDLGHTPFGHSGEKVLNELLPGGFHHVQQSLRVVDFLEEGGDGLNLTHEVRDGILKHSKGLGPLLHCEPSRLPKTLEGRIVRLADIIAYVNHDLDDALRAGLIKASQLPVPARLEPGDVFHRERDLFMIRDLVENSKETGDIRLSEEMVETIGNLRGWLFEKVYRADEVHEEFVKASRILRELFGYFLENEEALLRCGGRRQPDDSLAVSIADFLAGMTDRFALNLYYRVFLPQPWKAL